MSHLKDITGSEGSELAGKKVALCVTASISITEAPRIARLLMRHGADVTAVLTAEAMELVSPTVFEWSTGNQPITKISGRVEHVELVSSREKKVDAILVAPCTANMIAKISSGVADDPVSLLVCTALGTEIPIIVAPAMHEPMVKNPILRESIAKLEKVGVKFVRGRLEERKSKIATPEETLEAVLSTLEKTSRELESIGFLITAGPTREAIDEVRFISNASSGKMGVALARGAVKGGATTVCLISGPGVVLPKDLEAKIKVRNVVSTEDMLGAVLEELFSRRYRVFVSAAAPADYKPVESRKGKISTSESEKLSLELGATGKVIEVAKKKYPETFVVAFKAEVSLGEKELVRKARESLERSGADLVVANDVGRKDIGFGSENNEVVLVQKGGEPRFLQKASKDEIAKQILDYIVSKLLPASH